MVPDASLPARHRVSCTVDAMREREDLPWKTLAAALALVVAASIALVIVVTRQAETPAVDPVVAADVPEDASEIAADCAAAIAPARAFMEARPAGSALSDKENTEIRGLAADAYNVCSPTDMWAIRQYELFPWARSLAGGSEIG